MSLAWSDLLVMAPSRFIASRSSRHRTAALALYRSLLRSAKQIPIPDGAQQGPPSAHPVTQVVRKRFAKNRTYTSFRLIFAGMTAGYKFLGLFSKAQSPGSAEHQQVLSYLETRPWSSQPTRSSSDRSKSPGQIDHAPRPRIPLLTKISKPGQQPVYTPSNPPRPKEALTGERSIPRLGSTADGLPFLRAKKPQPAGMTQPMLRRIRTQKQYILNLKAAETEEVPIALLEDEWDYLVEEELRKQTGQRSIELADYTTSFSWSAQLSRLWWEWQVEKSWEDWKARGAALHEIYAREKRLAEQEAHEAENPIEDGSSSRVPLERHDEPDIRSLATESSLKVKSSHHWLPLPDQGRAAEPGGPTAEEIEDPYIARSWQGVVSGQHNRLRNVLAHLTKDREVGFPFSSRTTQARR
ncbi:hypothetical protein HJFPF1_09187 [Paramyrothecium foliicola]|nr:hypothetical protein HJFPF1_09187 [Paramyrothecium foliicola]